MIGFIVKSGPYSSSRVKETLRAAVGATVNEEVEVILIGPGRGCLDAEGDDWADEIEEHVETIEEFGALSVGHGRLPGLIDDADTVITA